MEYNKILTPVELAEYTINVGEAKSKKGFKTLLISAIFSGMFITLGALGSLGATYGLYSNDNVVMATYGLAKYAQGFLFAAGLMFVIFLGTDLFTGNILITMAWLKKKVKFSAMISNWGIVWIGNFIGALLIGYIFVRSGVLGWSDDLFAGVLLKTAYGKSHIDFATAFFSGVICNILVCLVILATYATKNPVAKMLIIILGIMIFVASGSEHVVANMGYYAAAFFSKGNADAILHAGKESVAIVEAVSPGNVFINNFIPVTLGNIVGGALFVAGLYFFMVKDKLSK